SERLHPRRPEPGSVPAAAAARSHGGIGRGNAVSGRQGLKFLHVGYPRALRGTRPAQAELVSTMERARIPELDLLLFTARACVVLFHATHWPSQPTLLTQIFAFGSMGVPLFFMISGFVILMTAQNRSGIEFINSRVARLYPSFWIAVLLSSLALAVF